MKPYFFLSISKLLFYFILICFQLHSDLLQASELGAKLNTDLAPAQSLVLKSPDEQAVRLLDDYLRQLEEHAAFHRKFGGSIFLALGGAFAVGGVVTSATNVSPEIPITLAFSAAITAGIGALVLVFPRDQETLPSRFRSLPEDTPEKLSSKRLMGESYLSIFGHEGKRIRVIGSLINMLVGGSFIGWYASEVQRSVSSSPDPFLLYGGSFLVGIGVVRLFVESREEIALKDYTDFKSKQANGGLLTKLKLGVSPLPDGIWATLGMSF